MAQKVESFSNEFNKHIVETRTVSGPYTEEDWGGTVYIQGTYIHILDDGNEIECCAFYTEGIQCIDYSIQKAIFGAGGQKAFLEYLQRLGLSTETVEVDGDRWNFGIIETEDCYCAQYYLDYTGW